MQHSEHELSRFFKMDNQYVHAGFWKRVFAHFLDGIIINGCVILLACIVILITQGYHEESFNNMVLTGILLSSLIVPLLINPIYQAIMESSKKSATLGKMILGITVIGAYGQKITFARALGRAYLKAGVNFFFMFAHIAAAFETNKRSLHDLGSDTYVINKKYLKELYIQHYEIDGNNCCEKVMSSDEIKKMARLPIKQLTNNTLIL